MEPHRGPSVARLTREPAQAVYEVRAELEGLARRHFAEKATEDQQQALKDAFKDLKQATRRRDQHNRVFAKNEFYARLIEGAHNEALGSCLRILNSRITFLRATSMQVPGRMQKSLAELSQLMDALLARDPERASKLARAHVTKAAKAALKILPSNDAD